MTASPTPQPDLETRSSNRRVRLAYLVSHPIQYQAPLLRRIAQQPDIDLTVLFGSDFSVRGYKDEGFGVEVSWDTPLLDGYRHEFLPNLLASRDPANTGGLSPSSPISRGILATLQRLRPDALWVHGYASINALHGILAAKALGIPVLLRAESWLADRARSPIKLAAKTLFFQGLGAVVDAVLPIGSVNAAYWSHYIPSVPQFLMPYAVDNAYFSRLAEAAAPTQPALRAEIKLDAKRPVILFASKLQTRKHADHLVHAFHQFLGDRGTPSSPAVSSSAKVGGTISTTLPYLVIVGDGEERANLEALTASLGLSDHVRFPGFRNQSELPRFFQLASVFVLPSRHEPWGLIVNESMASGCPVIVSTDVGSHQDLIPTTPGGPFLRGPIADGWGTTTPSTSTPPPGIVYPVGDIPALTAALHTVFATPTTPSEMGSAARARMSSWSFDQDIQGLRRALAHTTGKLLA